MLPYKEVSHGQPISRQKLAASPIPWHGTAAGLILDFYSEVRRLEVSLGAVTTGMHGARRGGSDRNTRLALQAITEAVYAPVVDDQMVLGVLSFFERWIRQAQAVFNPDTGLHRIPRSPGEEDMRCPWCSYQTMRWQPSTGIIVCINPECRTDGGIRPRWHAAYEIVDSELQFTWEPMGETDT